MVSGLIISYASSPPPQQVPRAGRLAGSLAKKGRREAREARGERCKIKKVYNTWYFIPYIIIILVAQTTAAAVVYRPCGALITTKLSLYDHRPPNCYVLLFAAYFLWRGCAACWWWREKRIRCRAVEEKAFFATKKKSKYRSRSKEGHNVSYIH